MATLRKARQGMTRIDAQMRRPSVITLGASRFSLARAHLSERFEDLAIEFRMTLPGLRRDELAIADTLLVDPFATALLDFESHIAIAS